MKFDMNHAREICVKLNLRYPAKHLIDMDYQAALAAEMLPAALDEIERLQVDICYPGQCKQMINAEEKICEQARAIDQQAARIAELEADNQNLANLNAALMKNDEALRYRVNKYRKRAQEVEARLAEGKIGISDHIVDADKMMLTKEQRAALNHCIELIDRVLAESDFEDARVDRAALRALLASSPAWEATAERREALRAAVEMMSDRQCEFEEPDRKLSEWMAELRAMLEEVGK